MSEITIKNFTDYSNKDMVSTKNRENTNNMKKDYYLVAQISAGEKDAWNEFVTDNQNFLYYSIKKIINKVNFDKSKKTKALNLVDDLFIEFFEHLLKNDMKLLKSYKGKSKLSSYLYVCLRNFIFDFFKSKRWKLYLSEISSDEINNYTINDAESKGIDSIIERQASDSFNPENEFLRKEMSSELEDVLSSILSERERLCFDILFVDGLKPSEASLILDMSSLEISQFKYKIKEKIKKAGKDRLKIYLEL